MRRRIIKIINKSRILVTRTSNRSQGRRYDVSPYLTPF
nr:MAG TPA: hypothetical protein [Caudoviricetes sp.]